MSEGPETPPQIIPPIEYPRVHLKSGNISSSSLKFLQPLAMISITLKVETEEFGPLTHTTWAVGANPEYAWTNWKRTNRNLAPSAIEHHVVSRDARKSWRAPIGRRDFRNLEIRNLLKEINPWPDSAKTA